MCCRVCARYTGHAQVTLNGVTLTTSAAGNFDSTLVCHDYSYLPSGLLPISVQYASDPTDVNNAFQFWIIPVKSVTEVANPVSSPFNTLDIAYHAAGWFLQVCSRNRASQKVESTPSVCQCRRRAGQPHIA